MMTILLRTTLIGSGLMLGLIGTALMFTPKVFLQKSHMFLAYDTGLMSELSAPSGVLIITGALMLLGGVKLRFSNLALVVGATVYGSYGFGRVVSMILHGVPPQSLITATVIELGVAAALIVLKVAKAPEYRQDIFNVYPQEAVQ